MRRGPQGCPCLPVNESVLGALCINLWSWSLLLHKSKQAREWISSAPGSSAGNTWVAWGQSPTGLFTHTSVSRLRGLSWDSLVPTGSLSMWRGFSQPSDWAPRKRMPSPGELPTEPARAAQQFLKHALKVADSHLYCFPFVTSKSLRPAQIKGRRIRPLSQRGVGSPHCPRACGWR